MSVNPFKTLIPPTADNASEIAGAVLGKAVASARRFTTGAGNWVFDVEAESGERVVVRFVRAAIECEGGVYFSRLLRPLGVPLPELFAFHVPQNDDDRAWMVLERLPGDDLGHAYPSLTRLQKIAVLNQVMHVQKLVRQLPASETFGYTDGPNPPPHASWRGVLDEQLARSRRRIAEVGVVPTSVVDRVGELVERHNFDDVRPIPFLDDTTTRNVIVHQGVFQGIVDVDGICYGDPLLVVALTRMSTWFHNGDQVYTDTWVSRLDLAPNHLRRFDLYTAMFAVIFLSEQGQQFNQDAPPAIDSAHVARLTSILNDLLDRLS